MCERAFSRLPRQIPDIPSVKADADHIGSTKAVLAGIKERYEKTGKLPALIHTVSLYSMVNCRGD